LPHQATDRTGAFKFEHLPDDQPVFQVKVSASAYPVSEQKVTNEPRARITRSSLRFDRMAVITARGIVVDKTGRPLEGLRVTANTDYRRLHRQGGPLRAPGVAPDKENKIRCYSLEKRLRSQG